MLPDNSSSTIKNSDFFKELKQDYNLKKTKTWKNHNSTVLQEAFIIDIKDLKEPQRIISNLFSLKQKYDDQNFVAVPTAGWKTKKSTLGGGFISNEEAKNRLEEEYAQSNSLSELSTAKNASMVLRVSKQAQIMEILTKGDQKFLRVSGGVRITDAEKFLLANNLALPPNMPTLHVASLVGAAANGCYGPAKNYGSMTTDIVKMKIVNALGQELTLSEKKNSNLFEVIRDCHMGSCYVEELVFKVEPSFKMKSHNILFSDVEALKQSMLKDNYIDKEHFIAMYVPVDIDGKGDHIPRIRITNFERTSEESNVELRTDEQVNSTDYLNQILTETGEPVIDSITKVPFLRRKFYPFLLRTVALKTYGSVFETFNIDWSSRIAHIFGTYTDLPIYDINWLIQVQDPEEARELFLILIERTEKLLIKYAEDKQYPILNAFSRYIKGLWYPEGRGGIAPTGVDKEGHNILSFEFVTYAPLAETQAFKDLVNDVINYLDKKEIKYNYHPGKHIPDNILRLSQIFKGSINEQRLENFKNAVYELHGGKENIKYSPLLTPQKKIFFGLENEETEVRNLEEHETISVNMVTKEKEKEVVQAILKHANEDKEVHASTIKKANKCLAKLDV